MEVQRRVRWPCLRGLPERLYDCAVDTDLVLLERWRNGDGEAGNLLFQRHFDSIYRFFDHKVEGDIDELVQATFVSCVRSRDQFRGQSSFRTYLFTIARHELYAYLRRRHRHRDDIDFARVSLEYLATSPTGRIAREQERKLLLHALRALPLEQQILLELHYWEDMDATQLAEVLDIAEPATRTRLSRARKALRERMQVMADAPLAAHTSLEDLDAWARRMRARTPGPETD
jgi:RNA polymerase sigma factor (sigma-70 family)